MSQNKNFITKVIYIAIIAVLLIPLSFLGRPTTKDSSGSVKDRGGMIAQVRDDHRLSQARLGDVDPASESMKLATLGLRGVAAMLLWNKAYEFKETENYDQFAATLKQITNLQPNFVSVWVYQAHNLSYNVSREFDDYQARYEWVKKGMRFMIDGISYNRRDSRILESLGFYFGQKFGRADERHQYRRLFRHDSDYHDELRPDVDIDSADRGLGGPDNWLVAYEWYVKARDLVDNEGLQPRLGPLMFYKEPAAQIRNYAIDIEKDFRPDEKAQQAWADALREWLAYGDREIRHSFGTLIRLRQVYSQTEKIMDMQEELGAMNPDVYAKIVEKKNAFIEPKQAAALAIPVADRTAPQVNLAYEGRVLQLMGRNETQAFIETLPEDKKAQANEIFNQMIEAQEVRRQITTYRGNVNYQYWETRARAEAEEDTILARQLLYDAQNLIEETKIDRWEEIDAITGESRMVDGARQKYEQAFILWKRVRDDFPELDSDSENVDDLLDHIKRYNGILISIAERFPKDFPLQDLIDYRGADGDNQLPTSFDLELPDVHLIPKLSTEYGEGKIDVQLEEETDAGTEEK